MIGSIDIYKSLSVYIYDRIDVDYACVEKRVCFVNAVQDCCVNVRKWAMSRRVNVEAHIGAINDTLRK